MTLPQRTALFSFVFPLLVIAVSYYLSWQGGHVELCNPFLQGCEAITASGIYYPAAYVFRGLIIAFICFALWWYCAGAWLESVREEPLKPWLHRTVRIAMAACVLGIASVAVMGENMLPVNEHRGLWRFHTALAVLFFLATSVCQILMARRMHQLKQQLDFPRWSIAAKVTLALLQLLLLTVFLVAVVAGVKTTELEQVIEWWLALLSSLFFLSGYWDWRDFRLTRLEKSVEVDV